MKIGYPNLKQKSDWEVNGHSQFTCFGAVFFTNYSANDLKRLKTEYMERSWWKFWKSEYELIPNYAMRPSLCSYQGGWEPIVYHERILRTKEEWMNRFIEFGVSKDKDIANALFNIWTNHQLTWQGDSERYKTMCLRKDNDDYYFVEIKEYLPYIADVIV